MIEYRIINYVMHKGKEYIILCDEKNRYFFLENDKLHNCKRYITLQEFFELAKNVCVVKRDLMQFALEEKKQKKTKIIPKVIVGSLVLPLTLTILQNFGIKNQNNEYSYGVSYVQESELDSETQARLDKFYEDVQSDMKFLKEISADNDGNDDIVDFVYDSHGLDQVLGNKKEDVTYDNIRSLIEQLDMSSEYKDIYITLANNLESQYPNMDLRIWEKNLSTLKVEEMSDEALKGMGVEYGAYDRRSNTIYIQDDYEFVPGTFEYQILVHEFTHPIRTALFMIGDVEYICEFCGGYDNYVVIDEAMNSIFSLRSYDQEETQIAYCFQSHMLEIMIECMDNYTMEDYVNEDIAYFINKLNEANGNDEAIRMLNLMQMNRDDYKRDDIYFEQNQFYDLYDYVAKMYYRKNINSNMTSEEITAVKDALVTRIITDVPEETAKEFDAAHFDDYLVEYCNENGINYSPSTKVK